MQGSGRGWSSKKVKTTPDTDGKSDRSDYIQEERDDNGGDDTEEDEDNEDDEEHGEGRVWCVVKTETGSNLLFHNINSEEDTFEGGWYSDTSWLFTPTSTWRSV